MKKLVTILVLLVYSASSIGATVHLHYCMNQFTGWDLWHNEQENECGKCGMKEKKEGCCKDEHRQIKIVDYQQKSTVVHNITVTATPGLITPFATYVYTVKSAPYFTPLSNAPPNTRKRLHLLNCVFLI